MQYRKLKDCVDSGRMQLGFWDKFHHYSIVIIFAALALMGIYFVVIAETDVQIERAPYIFLICSFVAIVFYFIQYRRLRFVILETKLTQDEISHVIDVVAKKLNWIKATQSKNYYTATTPSDFLAGSWGEQITILLHQKKIYINSICDLNKRTSVSAWGRNKKNVDVFRRELRQFEMQRAN